MSSDCPHSVFVLMWILRHANSANNCQIISAHISSRPIKFTVVHVPFAFTKIGEQFAQIIVIWRFKKVQSSDITEVGSHFLGVIFAQNLDGRGPFGVADLLIPIGDRIKTISFGRYSIVRTCNAVVVLLLLAFYLT